MAYGLQIFSANDAVNPIFSSETAFGFIELDSRSIPTTGNSSDSYTVTVDDGYYDVYSVYTPSYMNPNLNSSNANSVRVTESVPVIDTTIIDDYLGY